MPLQAEIINLLDECARMTREFYPAISVACLQLHHYVIPFLPVESRLSQVYGPRLQPSIKVEKGQEQTWNPCTRVLEGHTLAGISVAFSPDGRQLVSGSHDCTVLLWNVQTGALLQAMTGHRNVISSVTYSHDGKWIASCSSDGTVRTWNTAGGLEVGVYTEHSSPVLLVVFSADDQRIASVDVDGFVHIWSADTSHKSISVLKAPGAISLASVPPSRLLIVSKSGSVTVWEVETASCIEQYDHLGPLSAFAMAPDRKLAASLSETRGIITIWDVRTWTEQEKINQNRPVSLPDMY